MDEIVEIVLKCCCQRRKIRSDFHQIFIIQNTNDLFYFYSWDESLTSVSFSMNMFNRGWCVHCIAINHFDSNCGWASFLLSTLFIFDIRSANPNINTIFRILSFDTESAAIVGQSTRTVRVHRYVSKMNESCEVRSSIFFVSFSQFIEV